MSTGLLVITTERPRLTRRQRVSIHRYQAMRYLRRKLIARGHSEAAADEIATNFFGAPVSPQDSSRDTIRTGGPLQDMPPVFSR